MELADNQTAWQYPETRNEVLHPQTSQGFIAFVSDRGETPTHSGWGDIYVMNADGSNVVRIFTNPYPVYDLAFSPDGTKIAFSLSGDIHVINRDGSGLVNLSWPRDGSNPSWSPDGQKLAFQGFEGSSDIYVMNADGTDQTNLTNTPNPDVNERSPSWSPDGKKIVYSSDQEKNSSDFDIWVMNSDGSGQVLLTHDDQDPEPMEDDELNPAWSFANDKIAFTVDKFITGIAVMNSDGSGRELLTYNNYIPGNPAWSPDGTLIAFEDLRYNNQDDLVIDIYVMDANDGSGLTNLTDDPYQEAYPTWSQAVTQPIYSIAGHVIDNSDNPIIGVTVTLEGPVTMTATTSSSGFYEFVDLPAGEYDLDASLSGYTFAPASHALTVPPSATGVNFTGETSTYSISGRVQNQAGAAIAGVQVCTQSANCANTNAAGNYSIGNLAAGSYTLTATKSGYTFTPASRAVTVPPSATGVNFTGATLTYSISGRVQNQAGAAIAGVQICTQNANCVTTNASGNYSIGNLVAGSYTLTATKSGYRFAPPTQSVTVPPVAAGVNFTGTVVGSVPATLIEGAQDLVSDTIFALDGAADDSQAVIIEFEYFRAAVPAKAVDLGLTVIGGLIDLLSTKATPHNKDLAVNEAFPGWKSAIDLGEWAAPFACKLGNAFMTDIFDTQSSEDTGWGRKYAQVFRGGILLLAVYKDNKCLTKFDLWSDLAIDTVFLDNLLDAQLETPFTSVPLGRKISDSRLFLQELLEVLRAVKIRPLNGAAIDSYLNDLLLRRSLIGLYQDQLHDARLTLEAIHAANEQSPLGGEVLQIILRTGAKLAATKFFTPGQVAVKGYLLWFDTYMASNAFVESAEMLFLAEGTLLKTAPEVVQKLTDNANEGIEQIISGKLPVTPKGSILKVDHISEGEYRDPLALNWKEEESYSWVTIKNTGTWAGDFYVVARYQGEVTRLKVPWASLWLDSTAHAHLEPGASIPVRLDYRSGNQGYSPREARLFVDASLVTFTLVGVNDTGAFQLASLTNTWEPDRATRMADGATLVTRSDVAESPTVITDALVSAVQGGLDQTSQTGYMWVNNPFDAGVSFSVTQPLPENVVVLDDGGATVSGDVLLWTGSVEPYATAFLKYTLTIDSPPGTSVEFPAPTLIMPDPNDQELTIVGDPQIFVMPWPVTITRNTPDWIAPSTAPTISIIATNQMAKKFDGAFKLEIYNGEEFIHSEEHTLSIQPGQNQALDFSMPDWLDIGDYEVHGLLRTGALEAQTVFIDPVAVGAPPPRLFVSVAPLQEDGTAALGGEVDFVLSIKNEGDIPITSVLAGITMPADVQIVSLSDGGVRNGSQIQWSLGSIASGATKTLTARIKIPANFVAANQGRYIESAPFLSSLETPDATGPSRVVLVIGPAEAKSYLPMTIDYHFSR